MVRLISILFCLISIQLYAQSELKIDWAYTVDGYNTVDHADVLVDSNGNSYLAFNYGSDLRIKELKKDLPFPKHLAGGVLKFSPKGKPEWVFPIHSNKVTQIRTLAFAKNGDFFVSGSTDGISNYESASGKKISGGRAKTSAEYHPPQHAFLARYDSEGELIWVKEMDGWAIGTSVIEKKDGSIIWAIEYFSKLLNNGEVIDTTSANSSSIKKHVFLNLDSEGNFQSFHPFSYENRGENPMYNSRLNLDGEENLIIYGVFQGKIEFEGETILQNQNIHSSDAFVLKFDKNETFLWGRKIGGQGYQDIRSLRVKKDGSIYATGYYTRECSISNGVDVLTEEKLNPESGDNFLYFGLSKDGKILFADFQRTRMSHSYLMGMGIAIDANNRSHIIGYYKDTVDFGGRVEPIIGERHNYDVFQTVWKKDSIEKLFDPIELSGGWALPVDIVISGESAVVAGIYYGHHELKGVNGKKFKFSEYEHGRSTFIYGYNVPKEEELDDDQQQADSIDLLADINPILACLSPNELKRPDVWVPVDTTSTNEIVRPTEGCGVIRKKVTAELFPNPTTGPTSLVLTGLKGSAMIQVFSSNGTFLLAQEIEITEESESFDFDFSTVASGTYLIQVVQKDFRKVLRLVKTNTP